MNLSQKLYKSGISALVFFALSLPQLYTTTNNYMSQTAFELSDDDGSCSTYKSKLLHTLIFFVVSILAMKYVGKSDKSLKVLAKYSLFGSLLFFFISSTEAYRFTNSIYSGLSDDSGCPKMLGLFVHTGIFVSILTLMMYLPVDEEPNEPKELKELKEPKKPKEIKEKDS